MFHVNPHFPAIVLEAGFAEKGRFFSILFSGLQSMAELFRRRVIQLLVGGELLNEDFARNLNARKRAWARLPPKAYEVDPFVCPKCGAEMKVIAIIEDPDELGQILRHLIKIGRSPPGLDPDRLN